MTGVVANPGASLDHLSHARQGPKIAAIAIGPSPSEQGLLHPSQLFGTQTRHPARAAGRQQSSFALAQPSFHPIADRLAADPQAQGHGCWSFTLFEHARRLQAPLLHGNEITSRPDFARAFGRRVLHAHIVADIARIFRLLYEVL